MGFRITNIDSIHIPSHMLKTERAIGRALESLASGKETNRFGDDPATISEGLRLNSEILSYAQDVRNVNDAQGVLTTASDAITRQIEIVERLSEIATQGATGTLSGTDRSGLTAEAQNLLSEYNRIASQTSFAGTNLLDGSFGTQAIQVGTQQGNSFNLSLGSTLAANTITQQVGTGTFNAVSTYAVGTTPKSLATADFNNDGSQDVVVGNYGSSSLSILLGNGTGTVVAQNSLTTNGNTVAVATGDLLGNGIQDVVSVD